jgi:hypothetical protein
MAPVEVFSAPTAPSPDPASPRNTPVSPDQKPDVESQLKASIPLIIFVTCAIGGTFILIMIGINLRKWHKKRKERKEEENHEQWLARQFLDREEARVHKMAFGGWFGRQEIEGHQPGARTRYTGGYAERYGGEGKGMEMAKLQKLKHYR